MEIEGFRLENRMEPFDTGIICWCFFSGHGADDAFFYSTMVIGLSFLLMNLPVLQDMVKIISKYFLTRACYYYKIIWYV